jgi:hypothetical protein
MEEADGEREGNGMGKTRIEGEREGGREIDR